MRRIATLTGIAAALAVVFSAGTAEAVQSPSPFPTEGDYVQFYNENFVMPRLSRARPIDWNNNKPDYYVRVLPAEWMRVPAFVYGPFRAGNARYVDQRFNSYVAPLKIYNQAYYRNPYGHLVSNLPPTIVQTGGDTAAIDTSSATAEHVKNVLWLLRRHEWANYWYGNDSLDYSTLDFQQFVANECFTIQPSEEDLCMSKFGPYYNLRTSLMSGAIEKLLEEQGYMTHPDSAQLIVSVKREIAERFY